MKHEIVKFSITCLAAVCMLLTPLAAMGGSGQLETAGVAIDILLPDNLGNQELVEIPIVVRAGNQKINALDVHFDFNNEAMQIESIQGIAANGWIEMQTKFDNEAGSVDYAAVTLGESSGEIQVCILKAKVMKNARDLKISFVYEPKTRTTRVEYNGKDVCNGNANVTKMTALGSAK